MPSARPGPSADLPLSVLQVAQVAESRVARALAVMEWDNQQPTPTIAGSMAGEAQRHSIIVDTFTELLNT